MFHITVKSEDTEKIEHFYVLPADNFDKAQNIVEWMLDTKELLKVSDSRKILQYMTDKGIILEWFEITDNAEVVL